MENIKNKIVEIEVEGKTLEDAVKKASGILKVPKEQLKIKIVTEEQKGLFGMAGAKPAKVRVTVKQSVASKKKP